MLRDSRTSIHFGVGFIFAPQPVMDQVHRLDFQAKLAAEGLSFTAVNSPGPGVFQLVRQGPPLDIQLTQPGPVGQLVIMATWPQRSLSQFVDEATAVCDAFSEAWPGPLQIVQRDCTIRALYDVPAAHAFQYLWEQRLACKEEELHAFGAPVAGGGLRFMIAPDPSTANGPGTEVRIESFLADPTKLFVDVSRSWLHQAAGERPSPEPWVIDTERFATNEVESFIAGEHQ